MAWSEETDKYRAGCLTSSARSGQTVDLTLELQARLGTFGPTPPRPLLIRCAPDPTQTLREAFPRTPEQLAGVARLGAITAGTATATRTAQYTATFELPAGLQGDFQLVLDWPIDAENSEFIVVAVPNSTGIFTITP